MSGSSGSGVFRAFKNVTDLKFASVIKGMLFDVERETMTTHNEGAIHALRYPVQAAKTGFKGAVGARRIEYESAKKEINSIKIRKNLSDQLTSPVKWDQTIKKMIEDGTNEFHEIGPGNVLKGLIRKINRDAIIY